jgi:aminoglycoside 6-adenylyltransferase
METTVTLVINRLIRWAQAQPPVRALLLTGSRATPNARVDRLSDYDLEVIVTTLSPFTRDEAWLRWYGTPLVLFRDGGVEDGFETLARLVLYEDGTRIDYNVSPVGLLQRVATAPRLPDGLDIGYQVLVDKDGLTKRLPPPTHTAYTPHQPTAPEFQTLVEEFWWGTTYVAKYLWRDELLPASYSLHSRRDELRRVLEWRVELDHAWSVPLGVRGRGLRQRLTPETWSALEQTFAGPGRAEHWRALARTTALFGKVTPMVAAGLGYDYPEDLD